MLEIHVTNQQSLLSIDESRLQQAVQCVLRQYDIRTAEISLAVVDDPTIHELNCRFLNHDEPTDVLSFLLERDGDRLEAEVIVSADTASQNAGQFGWSASDELLLYVIHGTLHLVGFDDQTPRALSEMRAAERHHLAEFGLEPRYAADDAL